MRRKLFHSNTYHRNFSQIASSCRGCVHIYINIGLKVAFVAVAVAMVATVAAVAAMATGNWHICCATAYTLCARHTNHHHKYCHVRLWCWCLRIKFIFHIGACDSERCTQAMESRCNDRILANVLYIAYTHGMCYGAHNMFVGIVLVFVRNENRREKHSLADTHTYVVRTLHWWSYLCYRILCSPGKSLPRKRSSLTMHICKVQQNKSLSIRNGCVLVMHHSSTLVYVGTS